jgi:Holliday junction resolvasome RuvABC endonuclease subunit
LIAIETAFLVPGRPVSAILSVLGMMMRDEFKKRRIKYVDVAPNQLKKFVTGKGNGPKDQISMHLYKNWGIEAADNNQADAAGLAKIAQAVHFTRKGYNITGLTKPQQDVLGKVNK